MFFPPSMTSLLCTDLTLPCALAGGNLFTPVCAIPVSANPIPTKRVQVADEKYAMLLTTPTVIGMGYIGDVVPTDGNKYRKYIGSSDEDTYHSSVSSPAKVVQVWGKEIWGFVGSCRHPCRKILPAWPSRCLVGWPHLVSRIASMP